MGIKFFGHYLLDEGELSNTQLTQALDYQAEHNLSLGELAVKEGLLSTKDADKINDLQRTLDKRFGEIAISLGLLVDEQILGLLTTQKKNKIFFGEILVLKEFMSKEAVDKALKAFEQQQYIEVTALDEAIVKIDTEGLIRRSIGIFEKLFFRIVREPIKLSNVYIKNDPQAQGVIAFQKMRGERHLDLILQAQDAVYIEIAEKFLKMPFDSMDEIVLDVVTEFTNVVLGNIAVQSSEGGVKVDLEPPLLLEQNPDYTQLYSFEFITSSGTIVLSLKL